MERYRIDCEGSTASTEPYWIYDNAQRRPVCRCERFTDAERIAALFNADEARQHGDDLPACPACHGSGCRLKDAPAAERYVPHVQAVMQMRVTALTQALDTLTAYVDDLQRRLGKEEK